AGRYAEAKPAYARAIEIFRGQPAADPLELQTTVNNLVALSLYAEDYAAAEPLLRRVVNVGQSLSKDDPNVAAYLNNLAALLLAQHKCAEARPLLEEAVRIQRSATGKSSAEAGPSKAVNVLARDLVFEGTGFGLGTPGLNPTLV